MTSPRYIVLKCQLTWSLGQEIKIALTVSVTLVSCQRLLGSPRTVILGRLGMAGTTGALIGFPLHGIPGVDGSEIQGIISVTVKICLTSVKSVGRDFRSLSPGCNCLFGGLGRSFAAAA